MRPLSRMRLPFALLTSVLVFSGVMAVRGTGLLQGLELTAYDWQIRLRSSQAASARIALVTITEDDIRRLGRWPPPRARSTRLRASSGAACGRARS